MTKFFLFACSTLIISALTFSAYGEDWPAWRGKLGDGTINDTNAPVDWKLPEDLAWKTPIPGKGHASPIIIGERIYLVAVIEETETRELLCLDRKSGKELWRKVVLKSPLERVHRLNS
ncbi:MAG: serine/threonine protein kinase, partial [Opitutae bacterium]|nr:serine/threonine protein kinase [Opitutae bacterium]